MSGRTLLNLYGIIFSFMLIGLRSQANEYDFVAKSIIEPYVLGANSGEVNHSLFLTLEQNWQTTSKKHKAIAQFNFQNISYNLNSIKFQRSEIFPGELYYEWSHTNQRLTLGYQYLRLVDGFDTVGMESLNPEDQNESLFAKHFIRYRSVPAVNYKLIFSNFSAQVFNVFQPKANISNDYLLNKFKTTVSYVFIEDDDAAKFFKRNDTGMRLLGSPGWGDWSFYGVHVYEKNPLYQFNVSALSMTKKQIPYNSLGGSLTFDFDHKIVRFDIKYNNQRSFLNRSLEIEKANEVLFNFGFEPSKMLGIQWSFNYSHSEVTKNVDLLLRKQKLQDFYFQLTKKINAQLSLNSILIRRLSDSGSAVYFEVENNLSKSIDLRFGAEYFHKKDNTEFGQMSDLSRIYFGFNAYTSN